MSNLVQLFDEVRVRYAARIASPFEIDVLPLGDPWTPDPVEFSAGAYVDEPRAWVKLEQEECVGRRQGACVGQLFFRAVLFGLKIKFCEAAHRDVRFKVDVVF